MVLILALNLSIVAVSWRAEESRGAHACLPALLRIPASSPPLLNYSPTPLALLHSPLHILALPWHCSSISPGRNGFYESERGHGQRLD